MKTTNQVRRKPAKNTAIPQRQTLQVAASIAQRQKDRARSIDLDLPGMAGGSWSDEVLLKFVCRIFAEYTAQRILKELAADKIERFCSVIDFVDFDCVVRSVAARARKGALPLEMTFTKLDSGLGSWRTLEAQQVLEMVCIIIYNLREPFMAAVRPFDVNEHLPFAEALLIAEAVSHRAGYWTELDDKQPTPIQRWATAVTISLAKDGLSDIAHREIEPVTR